MALLNIPLSFPVKIHRIDRIPKLIAGGKPVVPINMALSKKRSSGATEESLDTYARAAKLYVEFCAHRQKSLIDISNKEFCIFTDALLKKPFFNGAGELVYLPTEGRDDRTVDLILTLLYSLAADIENCYQGFQFAWRLYEEKRLINTPTLMPGAKPSLRSGVKRFHRRKYKERPVLALPDELFETLIQTAYQLWGNTIADGDKAFSPSHEKQRGALFYRNLGILLAQRYAGARRSEVPPIELAHIDPIDSLIYLETKGHRASGERLPVVLFPEVYNIIRYYVTHFRPVIQDNQQIIFLSHSTRNYGQPISPQSIRKILDRLSPSLPPPWNNQLTPHTLRHAFAGDLEELGGPIVLTLGMRHACIASSEPYMRRNVRNLAEKLSPMNSDLRDLITRTIP